MKELRLGAHLSVVDGIAYAIAAARAMSMNEIQIMTGPERSYDTWDVSEWSVGQFRKLSYEMRVTCHLPYMINPCEEGAQRRGWYKKAYRQHCQTAQVLGAKGVVLHAGFKKDLTLEKAAANFREFLESTWESLGTLQLLVETDSGSKNGSAVGSPEFIAENVRDLLVEGNVGMCLDTAHMYGRGLDLWNTEIRRDFLEEYQDLIGLVHLNVPDKEVLLGSFKDRHNTPFNDRPEMEHKKFLEDLAPWPLILERRSLKVIQQDNLYVRKILGQPLERQKA